MSNVKQLHPKKPEAKRLSLSDPEAPVTRAELAATIDVIMGVMTKQTDLIKKRHEQIDHLLDLIGRLGDVVKHQSDLIEKLEAR